MVPVAQETTANTVRLPYSFSSRFSLVASCERSWRSSTFIRYRSLFCRSCSGAETRPLRCGKSTRPNLNSG